MAGMTKRMLGAIRNPRTNVLGHCTGRLVEGDRGTRGQSSFDAAAVFAACAEHDVAVEINSRPERCDPPDELVTMALDAGCLFSIDSDPNEPDGVAPDGVQGQWLKTTLASSTSPSRSDAATGRTTTILKVSTTQQ